MSAPPLTRLSLAERESATGPLSPRLVKSISPNSETSLPLGSAAVRAMFFKDMPLRGETSSLVRSCTSEGTGFTTECPKLSAKA